MEASVRLVQNLLSPDAALQRLIDVIGEMEDPDTLGEPDAGILGRLQESRYDRGLEHPEQFGLPVEIC